MMDDVVICEPVRTPVGRPVGVGGLQIDRRCGSGLQSVLGACLQVGLATMSHELHRREGRYAVETMCLGGGQGLAAVFERA